MSQENLENKNMRIDAFELDDQTLNLLSIARLLGLIGENDAVHKIADGGAQFILSAGREKISKEYSDGLWFTLSPEDKEFMDKMLSDLRLQLDSFIQTVDDALSPKGDIFRPDATIEEKVADILRTVLAGNIVSIGDIKETSQIEATVTLSEPD